MGVETDAISTETLLHDLGGCGLFQVLLYLLMDVSSIPSHLTYHVEGFGVYNPGWKCLDNSTSYYQENPTTTVAAPKTGHTTAANNNANDAQGSSDDEKMWTEYGVYSCPAYESCKNVEFSPDASTIVTEWGLICNEGWILSTVLACRMAGNLCSTLLIGYVGDRFGRRPPYLATQFIVFAFNFVSIFSVNWQMYAAMVFFMGFFGPGGILSAVIMSEYVPPDWRLRISSLPAWDVISILLTLLTLCVPDWRTLRIIATVSGVVLYIPIIIWFPESLRWMSIKGKKEQVVSLVAQIAKINKKPVPSNDKIDALVEKNSKEQEKPIYTILHLFRKGYRLPTVIVGFVSLSLELIFVAFHLGVAKLPGNYYTNSIVYSALSIPSHIIAFFVANKLPRKPTLIVNFSLGAVGLFSIVAVNLLATGDTKSNATIALVMITKTFLAIGRIVLVTAELEFYPTVVRSTVRGYTRFLGSVGGVFAPYLVPNDPRMFYVCYLAMAILAIVCSGLLLFFPETKGKPLKDTWQDDEEVDDDDDDGDGGGGWDDVGNDAIHKQIIKHRVKYTTREAQ